MSDQVSKEDILKELFNVGVGHAAATLSDIIDKKIVLNVPDVKILDIEQGKSELDRFLHNVAEGAVMVSSITFDDQLEGKISLIFPADKMHCFISLCLHEEYEEAGDMEFTDIDFDTIKEIGNIVLNAIIGELSNTVNIPVRYSLPEVKVLNGASAELFVGGCDYHLVLMLYITFNIEGTEIEGAIVINMTLKSLEDIVQTIDRLFNGR
ncbi:MULTISPECIES: chemotaxis protein CheC [unclassified Sporolactobacillus]|uniref:chemotaxis protein CheC n=1 Tax=unclassified Sporolactobacillus TaxID=2628533 RepID=UPI0023676621|nr:chemotaxis protein CheC [Sporolactobacillus sp. CQH2019]MDD9150354.1 chemotaxis protein CheC [Sporolactobacillus sp. CQH2019]